MPLQNKALLREINWTLGEDTAPTAAPPGTSHPTCLLLSDTQENIYGSQEHVNPFLPLTLLSFCWAWSHLVPDVEQEHVVLLQIFLSKVRDLCGPEAPGLVGTFKEPGSDDRVFFL